MRWMNTSQISYKRHRFPVEIIAHAVWLYCRFPLSLRFVEEMLLERGIVVPTRRSAVGARSSGSTMCVACAATAKPQ
jgi:transposase-like protein